MAGGAELGSKKKQPYGFLGLAVLVLALGAWWWMRGSPEAEASADAPASPARSAPTPSAGASAEHPQPAAPSSAGVRRALPSWFAQPDAPARRVAGSVTFEGQPVGGALVRLEPLRLPTGLAAAELRSGADGSFDFGVQPAMVQIVSAAAPGRTGAVLLTDLRDPLAAPAPDALELVLTSCDARLVGRVFDSGGGPIEHAHLRPLAAQGVETNAAGEFELCLPPGNNLLRLDADGYGSMRLSLLVLGKTHRDLLLIPEASIVGKVVTEEGNQPVADALVSAWPRQFSNGEMPAGGAVLSGPDGRFRIAVAPGDYNLNASARDAATRALVQVSALGGRSTDEVVIKIAGEPTLRGHVKSAGKAVPGAHVAALISGNGRVEAVSQEDGSFVIPRVPAGDLTFTASPFAVLSPKTFVMPKTSATVELEVKKKGSLRGVVRRPGGKVVAGAQVEVRAGFMPASTTSGPDGTYLVNGLAAGTFTVMGSSYLAGGFVEVKGVTLADAEDRTLDLELSSAASISGKVVSAQAAPVVGALVVFSFDQGNDEGRCVTDAEGHFVCNAMTGGGEYKVKVYPSAVTHTPYAPAGEPHAPVALADGASHVEGITLSVKYEQLSISGRVVDLAGAPVPDARVKALAVEAGQAPVFNQWTELPSSVTDAQGGFRIDGLTSGTWALQAHSPEGAEAVSPSNAAGASGVVITLRPSGGIDGSLVGYEEAPVVYARELAGKFVAGQVDGSTFHVSVPAGVYTVTAMNTREGDAQRVEVKEGAVTKVTMTSRGRGTLTGSVVEHTTKQPVAGLICHAVVTAGDQLGITNWDSESAPTTDAAGRFTVDPCPAGEIGITCFVASPSPEYSYGSQRVTLPRGGKLEVSLEVVRRRQDAPAGSVGLTFDGFNPSAVVTGVRSGSPAAKAGVTSGDLITAIDGLTVERLDASGVQILIGNHSPGMALKLGLVHGGQPREVALVTVPEP